GQGDSSSIVIKLFVGSFTTKQKGGFERVSVQAWPGVVVLRVCRWRTPPQINRHNQSPRCGEDRSGVQGTTRECKARHASSETRDDIWRTHGKVSRRRFAESPPPLPAEGPSAVFQRDSYWPHQ